MTRIDGANGAMRIRLFALAIILGGIAMSAQDFETSVTQFKAGYQIQGTVVKKHFLGERNLTITWNDGSSLDGILEYDGLIALVKGEYKNSAESIIGTFAVRNTKKGELTTKSKLPLGWDVREVLHYSIQRVDDKVELTRDGAKILVEVFPFPDDTEVSSITADVSVETFDTYGFINVDSLVLHSGGDLRIAYQDGQVFGGTASFARGYIDPIPVSGKISGLPIENLRSVIFDRTGTTEDNACIELKDSDPVEAVEFHIDSSDIPENGDEIAKVILARAQQTSGKAELTHGRSFVGAYSLRQDNNRLDVQLRNGTVDFGNGDSFTGNAGGRWIANIPVDGTTIFADGSSKQGNWLSPYKLSELDLLALSNSFTPSECVEEASDMKSHNNKTRTFSGKVEGPFGYYYGGRSLEIEEGTGKYSYYLEDGDRVLHGSYSFKLSTYLSSVGKDLVSVTGQNYNGIRTGEWQFVHKRGDGVIKADLREHYNEGSLQGPFTYIFAGDGMGYTIKGHYVNNLIVGDVAITFREGRNGFDLKGTFDADGWADGRWSLTDRRDKQETVFIFNHGIMTGKSGPSGVSVQDIFTDPYEPMAQYKMIKNGFRK